jgi:hypothetical protein
MKYLTGNQKIKPLLKTEEFAMKTKNKKSSLKSLWEKHLHKVTHPAHNHLSEEETKLPVKKTALRKKGKSPAAVAPAKWNIEKH